MKTRAELYQREASSLLRDISTYRAMTREQILRLYPGKQSKIENLLSYLTKQKRIHYIDGLYCIDPDCLRELDRGLLGAVWVLADLIEQVEYHSIGDFPAKLIFVIDGDAYEIVHAEADKEVLLSQVLAISGMESSRYLVLVDSPEQIERLDIPHAIGYCTVSPEGNIQYYQKD